MWICILRLRGMRRVSMDLNGFKIGGPGSFCMVDFLSGDDRCQDFSVVPHVKRPKHAMIHAVDTLEARVSNESQRPRRFFPRTVSLLYTD